MAHRIHFITCYIAPADLPTVRDLASGEQHPATAQDLLNMGIAPLPEPDHYSKVEQYRRDDQLLIDTGEAPWELHGVDVPRTLITQGPSRYRDLPIDLKSKIMLARVIQSTVEGTTAKEAVRSSLADQVSAINENVGVLEDGTALVDLSGETADVDEAKRLLNVPDSGLEVVQVTMANIDPDTHIVEATDIEPHRWAGERRF